MIVGLGIGSNLHHPDRNIKVATRFLEKYFTGARCSNIYTSSPVDCPEGSPEFLNMAAEITYHGDLLELLKRLKEQEEKIGRDLDAARNAPRVLDLDILYADDLRLDLPDLVIPHPRAAMRLFVLKPLSELCPERILPGQEKSVAELVELVAREFPGQVCRKIESR